MYCAIICLNCINSFLSIFACNYTVSRLCIVATQTKNNPNHRTLSKFENEIHLWCNAYAQQHNRLNSLVITQCAVYEASRTRDTSNHNSRHQRESQFYLKQKTIQTIERAVKIRKRNIFVVQRIRPATQTFEFT